MNLYIYSYNNYYNRQVKKAGDTLEDYAQYLHYGPVTGVYGFTPGDGVNTVQIIGTNAQTYDGKGNYLIAQDEQTNEIDSRWFIIDVNRTRNGQWELTLHRDLIVDYYDVIVDSPMFIEKATLPSNNNLIFNSENITVNQIKTPYNENKNEYYITDASKCGWLVGYYARKSESTTTTMSGAIADPEIDYSFSVADITTWEYYRYQTEKFVGPASYYNYEIVTRDIDGYQPSGYDVWYTLTGESTFTCTRSIGSKGNNSTLKQPAKPSNASGTSYFITAEQVLDQFKGKEVELAGLANSVIGSQTREQFDEFQELNGQIIYDEATQIYYQITVNVETDLSYERVKISSDPGVESNTLFGVMARQCAKAGLVGTPNGNSFAILNAKVPRRTITLEAVNQGGYSYSITSSRKHLVDAPYDMFAIPYGDEFTVLDGSSLVCKTNKEIGLATVNNMIENYGTIIYDVQLLPFCPVPNLLKTSTVNGQVNIEDLSTLDYSWIEKDETKIGIIFHPSQSSHSSYLSLSAEDAITISNTKIENECDMYRLCSPNFNSAFEFNTAKNGGLKGFNIYYTYYPYNPYIQIAPKFERLYGQTYNDSRGLICQGDFSITKVNNEWTQYQLQNKNYLNSFNRQIENMEVQHSVGRTQDIVNAISGTITGAAAGAMTGSMVGGGSPVGAIAGGIVGGVTSLAGGIADIAMNQKLRNEALDYTKDQFGYQLDNIKAMPYTLSKVSSLTVNNRIFPFVEYYTCTDEEKEAVANKIAWNGMTVMAIGKMSDYIGNTWSYGDIQSQGYIKGKLIRLNFVDENIDEPHEAGVHSEDYHVVNAISGELDKGVYIK